MLLSDISSANLRLRPQERIKHAARIRHLFTQGKSHAFPPFELRYCVYDVPEGCHQVLFSIPKKRIPKAVHRQQLRRRLRVAHRHHKYLLQPFVTQRIFFLIGYLYTGVTQSPYVVLQQQVQTAFHWLLHTYPPHASLPQKK